MGAKPGLTAMSSSTLPRGVDPHQVVHPHFYLRNIQTPFERFKSACRRPRNLGIASWVLAGVVYQYPAVLDLGLLVGLGLFIGGQCLSPCLPMKLPDRYSGVDAHDLEPGSETQGRQARGMFHLGNDRQSGAELYVTEDEVRTHLLILGGTGAGKTEAMLGLAAQALLWGSGFAFKDAKGDTALWAKTFALARACGREDDLYVINYLTGAATVDPEAPVERRLSNTFNPFATGSADTLTQLLVAQMAEAGGDSATWKDKAVGLLTVVVRVLVALRDRGVDERGAPFTFDVLALRRALPLDTLIDWQVRAAYRVDGFTLPTAVQASLKHYLDSVPGFREPGQLWEQQNPDVPFTAEIIRARSYPTQPEPQTYVQHGYLVNQFNRMLTQLADVYGHIYRVRQGEVDFADLVLNRRILLVQLPALEKSPDELASLGKVIVAAMKTMLAVGLGARLEGAHREVIVSKPLNAPSPFLDFNDEYGYYAVKGFAVVAAQARALGFAVCFGGQDSPSFGKESKEEAAAIFGNTLIKIAMKIEDAHETFELFHKTAGEAWVTPTSGFARSEHAWLSNTYHDTRSASVEKRSRIDLLDLREQRAGQAHIFQGSTLIRADLFYARPPTAPAYRLNRFIELLPPTVDVLQAQQDEGERPERWRFPDQDGLRAAIGQIEGTPNPLLDLLDLPHNADLTALRRTADPACFITGLINGVLKIGQVREPEGLTVLATVEEEELTEETLFHCGLSAGQPPLEVYQEAPNDAGSGIAVHPAAPVVPPITIDFQEAARRLDPDFASLTPRPSASRGDEARFPVGKNLGVFDAQEILAQIASIRPPNEGE
jgi:intracellular multiplication protein IcmO